MTGSFPVPGSTKEHLRTLRGRAGDVLRAAQRAREWIRHPHSASKRGMTVSNIGAHHLTDEGSGGLVYFLPP